MNGNQVQQAVGASGSQANGVPLTQALALDRRLALNAQQRSFQVQTSHARPLRPRPPC